MKITRIVATPVNIPCAPAPAFAADGSMRRFHDAAMPGRFRRLPLS